MGSGCAGQGGDQVKQVAEAQRSVQGVGVAGQEHKTAVRFITVSHNLFSTVKVCDGHNYSHTR